MTTYHLKRMVQSLNLLRDNLVNSFETNNEKLAAQRLSQAIDSIQNELDIRESMPAVERSES